MINRKMPMLAAAFDFSGISPWNPLASPNPDPGAYKATITDVDPAYNNGKSTKFSLNLESGHSTDLYIGNEPGEKGGNVKKWLQALASIAPDVEKFLNAAKAGQIKFDPAASAVATFKGKTIHVLVIEVPGVDAQGRPNLPNKEFITPAQYAQVKASGTKPTASAPKANGATAGATPAAGATSTGTPAAAQGGGDVLGALFGG